MNYGPVSEKRPSAKSLRAKPKTRSRIGTAPQGVIGKAEAGREGQSEMRFWRDKHRAPAHAELGLRRSKKIRHNDIIGACQNEPANNTTQDKDT